MDRPEDQPGGFFLPTERALTLTSIASQTQVRHDLGFVFGGR